jgi:AcrR family transcriptional regulator
MEAASPGRELSGDKAQRIVDAMRTSVGLRGATGSTFDHVAREAGVSRGLLHYYFGTKERLLVEVVRRDCDLRMERLTETITGVESADALLGALVQSLNETIEETPEFFVILLELHTLARRNEEIAAEVAELHRRVRGHLAGLLEQARADGVIRLAGEPEAVSEILFALGDGLAMRMLAEPERDYGSALAMALTGARALVIGDAVQDRS